jgi:hypothetical protein
VGTLGEVRMGRRTEVDVVVIGVGTCGEAAGT